MCNLCNNYVQLFKDSISVCCPAWNKLGMVPREDRTYKEVWESEEIQEVLKSAARSNDSLCYSSCPYYKVGGNAGGPRKITRIMISFDETCNIRCQTCRKVFIKTPDDELKNRLQEVEEDFSEIEALEVSGSGDPFASPVMREWICSLSKEKFPKLKSIFIQTNGLKFTEKLYNRLPDFVKDRLDRVIISMDAPTKELYEKIRIGGDWEVLQKNIKFLAEHISRLAFCFVVQTDNYKYCVDFYNYCQSIRKNSIVMYQQLSKWGDRVTQKEFDQQNIYGNEDPNVREELRQQLKQVSIHSNVMMQGEIPPSLKPLKKLL